MYLPPNSPDINPIEMTIAKLKTHLRAMAMRTINEIWKTINKTAISHITKKHKQTTHDVPSTSGPNPPCCGMSRWAGAA